MKFFMLLLVLVSNGAFAATTYQYSYQGNAFNAFVGSTWQENHPGLYALSGSFQLDEALEANFVGVVDVTSFVFTDGYEVFDSSMASSDTAFRIQTDELGSIKYWNIDIRKNVGGTTSVFQSLNRLTDGLGCCGSITDNTRNGAEILSSPGVWSVAVVPIPAALILLLSAMSVLPVVGRMQRR